MLKDDIYLQFGSRVNMNHDSSQSNSISCVTGGSVSITQNLVACEYPMRVTASEQERSIAGRSRSLIH